MFRVHRSVPFVEFSFGWLSTNRVGEDRMHEPKKWVGCFLLSPDNEITQADKIALLGLHLFAQISKPKPRERDLKKPEALRAKPKANGVCKP